MSHLFLEVGSIIEANPLIAELVVSLGEELHNSGKFLDLPDFWSVEVGDEGLGCSANAA